MESSESPQKNRNAIDTFFENMKSLKASDGLFLKIALIASIIFISLFIIGQSQKHTVEVAKSGGTFSEGIIGTPRFINPVLAVTRADKDLTALVYGGIMKLGKDGVLVPDIAESITISEDGLVYNIVLKQGILFHDKNELTAKDILATVGRIQDPLISSPLQANFDGVIVEGLNEHELNFVLPEPYSPFIENLTFGILPFHIWKDVSSEEFPFSQHNTAPIGTGPYLVEKMSRNSSGIPEKYTLKAFESYNPVAPKIESLKMHFFPTDTKLIDAFIKGDIESVVGLSNEQIEKLNVDEETHTIIEIPLPRTFAVFINQNKSPALRDDVARKALEIAIDKKGLIDTVLGGYGNVLTSPIPPGFGVTIQEENASGTPTMDDARELLRNNGWKLNAETQIWEKTIDDILTPLSFSIATVNNDAFNKTAEFLQDTWTELGAEVQVKQFEVSDLTQSVIRPREYQALLFGTQLGRPLDYFSFWHSSQKTDPGLNISLYTNITTDSILNELRRSTNLENREETLLGFADEIKNENPAIFLYAPELIYVFPIKVKGAGFEGLSEPHERFSSIQDWYIKTESVWPFFN